MGMGCSTMSLKKMPNTNSNLQFNLMGFNHFDFAFDFCTWQSIVFFKSLILQIRQFFCFQKGTYFKVLKKKNLQQNWENLANVREIFRRVGRE